MMRRTVESKFDLVSAEYRLGRAARQAGAAQQSVTFRFRNFSVSKLFHLFFMVSVSVSKFFGIEKSIGIGFEKIWYQKKYRYRFRKNLVSKKVLVLVSEKIWYRKKYRIWYRKKLVSEKSFGFGFVQILGSVTH